MEKPHCGDVKFRMYHVTLWQFRRLAGQKWTPRFASKMGKAASKLYREIYGRDPSQRRRSGSSRNKTALYPCGIIEQAYEKLKAEFSSEAAFAEYAIAPNEDEPRGVKTGQ